MMILKKVPNKKKKLLRINKKIINHLKRIFLIQLMKNKSKTNFRALKKAKKLQVLLITITKLEKKDRILSRVLNF